MNIIEFLLARIAEDEVVAQAAVIAAHDGHHPHPEIASWRYKAGGEIEYDYDDPHEYPTVYHVTCDSEGILPAVDEDVAPHIARHDPARVLTECEVKRRIVKWHQVAEDLTDSSWPWQFTRNILRELAAVYADHPDYRQEWKP